MVNQRSVMITRRSAIRGLLSAGAFGVTSQLWTGCTAGKQASTAAENPITIGFIYVGPKDDYGYNQAHAEGAANMAKNSPWIKLVEEARKCFKIC
jgi:basic membrane protein A and related proteins